MISCREQQGWIAAGIQDEVEPKWNYSWGAAATRIDTVTLQLGSRWQLQWIENAAKVADARRNAGGGSSNERKRAAGGGSSGECRRACRRQLQN